MVICASVIASFFFCREYLTIILSCIYAVFVVTLGLVIYITDAVVGNSPIAEVNDFLFSYSFYISSLSSLDLQPIVGCNRIHFPRLPHYRHPHIHQQKEQLPQFAGDEPGTGGIQAIGGW